MSKKYWKKRAKELDKQEEFNEQFSGCLALIFFVVAIIVIGCL